MKRIVALALLFTVVFSSIPSIAAENTVPISINGEAIIFPDAQPFIDENNRTQVPIRTIAETLGMTVTWNEDTQTVLLFPENYHLISTCYRFTIGKNEIEIGTIWEDVFRPHYNVIEMDTAAIMKDNRVFVPIHYLIERIFSHSPDFIVEWDNATASVNLRSTKSEVINNTTFDIGVNKIFSVDGLKYGFSHNSVQYDESFFEDKFLLIVSWANGVPLSHLEAISATEKEDCIEIVLSSSLVTEEEWTRNFPAVVTTFTKTYEFNRSLSDKDVSLVFAPREN